ncbi:MAG: acyltransferase [Thermaerobacter sp.]|nr:acyltransferase [Thermaerobacter sp.]
MAAVTWPKKGYVEAADFVRALTIVSVVVVHSTWFMANGGEWVLSGAILAIMHFTRESFMALTGFVLTYSLYGKKNNWIQVWLKRYKLVLFPYLIWSAAYILLFRGFPGLIPFLAEYGHDLWTGGAWFHLYYLLITMQFYLVLPLFLALMKVGKKHPVWVVAVAFVLQMALMTYDQYYRHGGFVNRYMNDEVWTYAVYFVMGGVAALHWARVRHWLQNHLGTVVWLSLGMALVMLIQFVLETYVGHNLLLGEAVIQPAMVPWAMMSIVLLAAVGVRYEAQRLASPGRWALIKLVSDISFGIYLVHPMLLQYWTDLLVRLNLYHPSYWLAGLTVALLVAGSVGAMLLIGLTPFSPWLIGRAARRRPAPAIPAEPPMASSSAR